MLSHFHLYGELRSSGVMGRRNGLSGLRDDDDNDDEYVADNSTIAHVTSAQNCISVLSKARLHQIHVA